MGLIKKVTKGVFENSKEKSSQKERRKAIDSMLRSKNIDDLKVKIVGYTRSLFGSKGKSDTRDFLESLNSLFENAENLDDVIKGIEKLKAGKMLNGKKPSELATITSKDCIAFGEFIKKHWLKYYRDYCGEIIKVIKPVLNYFEPLGTFCAPVLVNAKEIEPSALENCNGLEFFSLPKAEIVGGKAFEKCMKLTGIGLPEVKKVQERAFADCIKLLEIDFPKAEFISKETFWGCFSLQQVNLPSVKNIGEDAFKGCNKLEKVTVPKSKVEEVKEMVPEGCEVIGK